MKLRALRLGSFVTVDGCTEPSLVKDFHALDGWDITCPDIRGPYAVHKGDMPRPVYVFDAVSAVVDDTTSDSSNGKAADGSGPATSADDGSKPSPTTKKGKR